MYPFNKILKNFWIFSLIKSKLHWNQLHSVTLLRMSLEVNLLTKPFVLTVKQSTKDWKTSILYLCRSKVLKILINLLKNWFKVKWFQTINVMPVRKKQTWLKVVYWQRYLTTSLSTSNVYVSTMINSKMRKLIQDLNSRTTWTFITILLTNRKDKVMLTTISLHLRVLFCIMEVPSLVIISAISSKAKIDG